MKIDNQNRSTWIKLYYYLAVLFYAISMIVLLYLDIRQLGLAIAGVSVVFVLFLVLMFLPDFNYVIYMETSDKIIFRYYPLHPFHDKFKSIEIPKQAFRGYEIIRKNSGFCTQIALLQHTVRGMAKYPPVSISGFSKKDRIRLLKELDRLKNDRN